ncbi:TPA: CoA ester lyase [Pseudomonas aeruginosa]|nr:CoA ester lyase [Pseudomonas aeruginosa]HEJ3161382.1 CoA ester lyase [Pseudomonas aeruginosa]
MQVTRESMAMRSLLFVPVDSERKLAKSAVSGADVIILDLEDSVLPANKARARERLGSFIDGYCGHGELWVRVNDLSSGLLLEDLSAAVAAGAAGVVLPKMRSADELTQVCAYLDMAEAIHGRAPDTLGVLPVCTETAEAVLRLPELIGKAWPRLRGMLWGAEDLSAALGAGEPRDENGGWRPLYQQARSQCLLICNALQIPAIDTVYVDVRNLEGCRHSAEEARYDGFGGKVAIHPDQVTVIHQAFTPSEAQVAHARRVVAAFAAGEGAVMLDGKMLDIPHLKGAQRLLGVTP